MSEIPTDILKEAEEVLKSLEIWDTTEPDWESDQRDIKTIALALMAARKGAYIEGGNALASIIKR